MGKSKDIRQAVKDELDFDPMVDATYIVVLALKGDVALNGTVASYPQYLEAAHAARRVRGVTEVHNHLEVDLPFGEDRDDARLTTAANNALMQDVSVPANVEAQARDGNITLSGRVTYGTQRLAAGHVVEHLIGVRNVHNKIEVQSPTDSFAVQVEVQDALFRSSIVPDDSDVIVNVDMNRVKLVGHVRTWAEHAAVVNAAWMADGVLDVEDDLLVTG